MTDTEELATLLVLRRQLLLDITELVELFDEAPHDHLSSWEYRRVLTSVQRFCHTRERVFRVDRDLVPHLRREIGLLGEDATLLRGMLGVLPFPQGREFPGDR